MVQGRENLPLLAKPLAPMGTRSPWHELEGHALLELSIGTFRQVDEAHATAANLADQSIGPQAAGGLFAREDTLRLVQPIGLVFRPRLEHRVPVAARGGEQLVHQVAQVGSIDAGGVEEFCPLGRGELQRLAEELIGLHLGGFVHGLAQRARSSNVYRE